MKTTLYTRLDANVREIQNSFHQITGERRSRLEDIARYVERALAGGELAELTFICTHNSRRSQLAQIWAQTAADYHSVPNVTTFSGGTEATAFHPNSVAALQRVGFEVVKVTSGDNPLYHVRYGKHGPRMEAFSKVYDTAPNPTENFLAVMTCAEADANCPFVNGAALRAATPYEDPKAYDGSDQETEKYDERCREIGTEMLYVFSAIGC